jgi:hypothetical protein
MQLTQTLPKVLYIEIYVTNLPGLEGYCVCRITFCVRETPQWESVNSAAGIAAWCRGVRRPPCSRVTSVACGVYSARLNNPHVLLLSPPPYPTPWTQSAPHSLAVWQSGLCWARTLRMGTDWWRRTGGKLYRRRSYTQRYVAELQARICRNSKPVTAVTRDAEYINPFHSTDMRTRPLKRRVSIWLSYIF